MNKERAILAQLLKNWAQDHNHEYVIASHEYGDDGVSQTGSHLSWVLQQEGASVDLLSLLDRLELYVERITGKRNPDGLSCRKCHSFYQYAEANQPDGTLICYSCRSNPYK